MILGCNSYLPGYSCLWSLIWCCSDDKSPLQIVNTPYNFKLEFMSELHNKIPWLWWWVKIKFSCFMSMVLNCSRLFTTQNFIYKPIEFDSVWKSTWSSCHKLLYVMVPSQFRWVFLGMGQYQPFVILNTWYEYIFF